MSIRLVFDSTIGLNEAEKKAYDIEITPFIINDKDEHFHDYIDIDPIEFCDRYKKNVHIKTSQPNIHETSELFKKLLEKYDEIIYCPLPSALSGTYASGVMIAKEIDPERIKVVDLNTGLGMARLLAKKGNEMIKQGKTSAEIISYFEKAKDNQRLFFIPETLDGLKRGGRVSNMAAGVFTMIKLKISIYLTKTGNFDKFEVCRTMPKMIKSIIKDVKEKLGDKNLIVYAIYSNNQDLLFEPLSLITKEFKDIEVESMPLSPTITAHTAPETVGFHFCRKSW
ncbi:MAG: DegV family protein [Bacilli bacterium]|nr:DegV family protein [Bacilli bacterium]